MKQTKENKTEETMERKSLLKVILDLAREKISTCLVCGETVEGIQERCEACMDEV